MIYSAQPECPGLFISIKPSTAYVKKKRVETHHHQVLGNPAINREVLQHGDQKLKATIPVAQQEHHADQVYYPNHGAGEVVGHVEDLRERKVEDVWIQTSLVWTVCTV